MRGSQSGYAGATCRLAWVLALVLSGGALGCDDRPPPVATRAVPSSAPLATSSDQGASRPTPGGAAMLLAPASSPAVTAGLAGPATATSVPVVPTATAPAKSQSPVAAPSVSAAPSMSAAPTIPGLPSVAGAPPAAGSRPASPPGPADAPRAAATPGSAGSAENGVPVPGPNRAVVQEGGTTIVGELVGPWTEPARRAFEFAARIVASNLDANVPIVVTAEWLRLEPGYVGSGGPGRQYANFPNTPRRDTFYPGSLANQLTGRRLVDGPDLETSYNSAVMWYFGTDARPRPDESDFVTTVIHEMLHGMGFLGTFDLDDEGVGSWGDEDGAVQPINRAHSHRNDQARFGRNPQALARHLFEDHLTPAQRARVLGRVGMATGRARTQNGRFPDVFDHFVVNGRGERLLDTERFPNDSRQLGVQLTSANLFWDGAEGTRTNGGRRIRLYAPSTWSLGSSVSHLDDNTYNGTPDALLTAAGEKIPRTDLGPLVRAMLADLGWRVKPAVTRR